MTDTAPEGRQVRPFADWLAEQRDGVLASELSAGLNDLVETVNVTGKVGTMTLKVTVKPTSKTGTGSVMVRDDITVKLPSAERVESLYFVDKNANLTRENPAQPRLPLRSVERAEGAQSTETQEVTGA